MAALAGERWANTLLKSINRSNSSFQIPTRASTICSSRYLQTSPPNSRIPDFAFAFEYVLQSHISSQSLNLNSIDGVLVRSNDPIPRAHEALSFLQSQRIPFILLTNGGGKHESERVADLTEKLKVPLNTGMFVQSHTPFADMDEYKDKTVLVVGGYEDRCRAVAERCVSLISTSD